MFLQYSSYVSLKAFKAEFGDIMYFPASPTSTWLEVN